MIEPPTHTQRLLYETALRTAVDGDALERAIELLTSPLFVAESLRILGSTSVYELLGHSLRLRERHPARWTAAVRALHDLLQRHTGRIARGGHLAFLQLATTLVSDEVVRVKAQASLNRGRAGDTWLRRVAQTSAPTDRSLQTFEWGLDPVQALTFAADGDIVIAVDARGRLGVWPLAGHQEIVWFSTSGTNASALGATRDGRYAITGSRDGVLRVFDVHDRCESFTVHPHTKAVTAIVVLDDDTRAASVAMDGSIAVWDLVDRKDRRLVVMPTPPDGAPRALHGAVFAARSGCLLAATSEGRLEVWDLHAGSCVRWVAAGIGPLTTVLSIPDTPDVLVVSATGVARVDPEAGTARLLGGELGAVRVGASLAVHPDARHLIHSRKRGVDLFDLETGACGTPLLGNEVVIDGFALTPDGSRLLTWYTEAGTLKVWDIAEAPRPLAALEGHPRPILAVCTDWRNDRVYTSSFDGDVRAWDVITGAPIGQPLAFRSAQYAVHHDTASDRLVLVGQDSTIHVYDAARTLVTTFELRQYGDPRSLLLPGGQRLVTGGGSVVDANQGSKPSSWHSLAVMDLLTGEVVMKLPGHTEEITALAAHPDPARIVSASFDRELRLWNLDDGSCTCFSLGDCLPRSMAVHPDGDCVWIGGTVLSLWSLRQGRLLGSFGQPGALIELVACCPSGERVLTVCRDRTARVWSTLTGQQIARWDGEDPFGAGAFGPGGRIILGDDVGRMTLLELTQLPPRSA